MAREESQTRAMQSGTPGHRAAGSSLRRPSRCRPRHRTRHRSQHQSRHRSPDQRRQLGEAATYDCGVTSSRGTGGGCPGLAERAGGPAEPLFPTATGGRLSRATDDDPQFYIDPDECIDCGACEPECPVTAIFAEDAVPDDQVQYIQINADYFKQ